MILQAKRKEGKWEKRSQQKKYKKSVDNVILEKLDLKT
jgi:hypothetical protein